MDGWWRTSACRRDDGEWLVTLGEALGYDLTHATIASLKATTQSRLALTPNHFRTSFPSLSRGRLYGPTVDVGEFPHIFFPLR